MCVVQKMPHYNGVDSQVRYKTASFSWSISCSLQGMPHVTGVHSCLWCRKCFYMEYICIYAPGGDVVSEECFRGGAGYGTYMKSASTASGARYIYLSNLNRTCLAWQRLWLGQHHLNQGCLASAELPQRLNCHP